MNEFRRKEFFDSTGDYSIPSSLTKLSPTADLNEYFKKEYSERYFFSENSRTIKNLPDKRLGVKEIPITEFYLKVFTVVQGMVYGQLLIEQNNVWVRTSDAVNGITPWELIYSTRNFDRLLIDAANNELDNISMQSGVLENQGAGKQSFKFPRAFEGIPRVFCSVEGWDIDITDVTAEGFSYRLHKPKIEKSTETQEKSQDLSVLKSSTIRYTGYAGKVAYQFSGYNGKNIRQRENAQSNFTNVTLTAPQSKTSTVSGSIYLMFNGNNYNNDNLYINYDTPIAFVANVKLPGETASRFAVGTMTGKFIDGSNPLLSGTSYNYNMEFKDADCIVFKDVSETKKISFSFDVEKTSLADEETSDNISIQWFAIEEDGE